MLTQEFDDYRDADDACHELNGRDFLGARIVVEHARGPRRDRDRDGGGGTYISFLSKVFSQTYSLCPEGAENISLGSQVSDLCF